MVFIFFILEKINFLKIIPGFFLKNFDLVWENRINMFLKSNAIIGRTNYVKNHLAYPTEYLAQNHKSYFKTINKYNINRIHISKKITELIDNYFNYIHSNNDHNPIYHYIFLSSLLGIVFLIIALLLLKITPYTGLIAALVLTKTFTIFLFRPFPRFQYNYPLYFMGFIIPIFIFTEYAENKHK